MCPGFQEWGEWAPCDVTCGSGRQQRTRECNGRINIDCRGSTNQVKACQVAACAHKYGGGTGTNPYGYPSGGGYGTQTGYGTRSSLHRRGLQEDLKARIPFLRYRWRGRGVQTTEACS